jgi:hypothetical protein
VPNRAALTFVLLVVVLKMCDGLLPCVVWLFANQELHRSVWVCVCRFQTLSLFADIASGLSTLLPSNSGKLNAQARTLQATSTQYYKADQTSSDVRTPSLPLVLLRF